MIENRAIDLYVLILVDHCTEMNQVYVINCIVHTLDGSDCIRT